MALLRRDRRPRAAGAAAALLLALPAAWMPRPAAAQEPVGEYQVKAAFLYQFLKFVEWPEAVLGDPEAPITLCVAGRDPFGPALDETVRGRTAQGRSCLIRRMAGGDDPDGCHLLFVASGEDSRIAETLRRVAKRPVLTVGESDRFEQAGGTIRFVLEEDRVRFVINAAAARRAGLRLSARLLSVARSVTGHSGPQGALPRWDEERSS